MQYNLSTCEIWYAFQFSSLLLVAFGMINIRVYGLAIRYSQQTVLIKATTRTTNKKKKIKDYLIKRNMDTTSLWKKRLR